MLLVNTPCANIGAGRDGKSPAEALMGQQSMSISILLY